jgi:hypothetical protein
LIAWLALREGVHYRREAFAAGLRAAGYAVEERLTDRPGPRDVLVCWNRYGEVDRCARIFEERGRPVLVAENGYLGNDFAGSRWYAIARSQHNGAGSWSEGGSERWDSLSVALASWRVATGDVVLLPQRGIGPAGVAMPKSWLGETENRLRSAGIAYRIRRHPGTSSTALPLEEDLATASSVVTWGSGAAIKALMMGIPVFSDMPNWIGASAALPVSSLLVRHTGKRSSLDRLAMFRRLAWAMWRLEEIKAGEPFRRLISSRGN